MNFVLNSLCQLLIICVCLLKSFCIVAVASQQRSLFLDTEQHSLIYYKSFFEKLDNLNIEFDYFCLSDILDDKFLGVASVDYIFVNLSEEFLKDLSKSKMSSCSKKILKIISSAFLASGNLKKVFYFVPAFSKISDDLKNISPLFFDIDISMKYRLDLKLFLLSRPYLNYNFLTSLRPGKTCVSQILKDFLFYEVKGFYKPSIFFVKNDVAYFGGIFENFNMMPCFKKDQLAFNNFIYSRLAFNLGVSLSKSKLFNVSKKPIIKRVVNSSKKLFAWLELPVGLGFKKEIDEIVDNLVKCRINIVWMTPAINNVFSKIGVCKNNQKDFLISLRYFFQRLKFEFLEKKERPHIYFSLEIANNLVDKNLPENCNFDIFGNKFFDQPHPLDKNFWISEVVFPIKNIFDFLKSEKKDFHFGVVLDLEMYLRKTGSTFCSTSGFSKRYVFENKGVGKVFKDLFSKSFSLWLWIKKLINSQAIPIDIAVYMPSIIPNWFYLGLLKGLQKKEGLTSLFSFSSGFFRHKNWFTDQGIFINHFEFFMLSKINLSCWKEIISELEEKDNAGFGFNRFSRLGKYVKKSWFELEQAFDLKASEKVSNFLKKITS